MGVLVASFIKPGKFAKAQARAAVQYNETRPGKNKEEIIRTLFGHDGPYTEEQVQKLIDGAPKNTYFWNLIVSPDPNGEENANRKLNLQQLTKDLVKFLEQRLNRPLEFVGAVQNDHTEIPHVHALVLIQRRGREMLITEKTLAALRALAAGKALEQQAELAQVRPLVPQRQQLQEHQQVPERLIQRDRPQPMIGTAGGRATHRGSRPLEDCHRCGMPWTRDHDCEEELELTLKLK